MKLFTRALAVLLPSFLASFATAQVAPGMFSNIIIIVQENRTPDNLFGLHAPPTTGCPTLGDFPGADIVNGGTNIGNGTYTCNAAYPMNSGQSPPHNSPTGSSTGTAGKWKASATTPTRRLASRSPTL